MATELQRASVFAIKEETTVGVPVSPTAGSDFIPLRPGFSQTTSAEELESDEVLDDIGATKSLVGIETPEGAHPTYLKHSEVEGQAPETALFLKSLMGNQVTNATQYDLVGGSTAGNSTAAAVLNVDAGEGAQFLHGQAVMVKDGVNGYSIRNVYSISGDALTMNFNLPGAPALGVQLGKAIHFYGAATGHKSFTAWLHGANGGYLQAIAGCKTTEVAINFPAGEQATAEYSYAGSSSYWNPIEITATTKYIDFTDDAGTYTAVLTEGLYKTPIALATEAATQLNALASDTITVSYSSTTGKFTISSDGAVTFSLLWNTGANNANSADVKLGFSADSTGAFTYTGTELSWAAAYTPSYDGATNLVVKSNELFIGTFSDNVCKAFNNVDVTITVDPETINDGCAESGLGEILPTARTATLEATLLLQRHEAKLFDTFINNGSVAVMYNAGAKDSSGNWVPGKCVNIYMPQASITQHDAGGDTVVEVTLSCKGYLSGTKKDIHINYI